MVTANVRGLGQLSFIRNTEMKQRRRRLSHSSNVPCHVLGSTAINTHHLTVTSCSPVDIFLKISLAYSVQRDEIMPQCPAQNS